MLLAWGSSLQASVAPGDSPVSSPGWVWKYWKPVVTAASPTSGGSSSAPGESAFHFSSQSQLPNIKGNTISWSKHGGQDEVLSTD